MKVCLIDGCDSRAVSRGWCNKHYRRWCEHGDPLLAKVLQGHDEERFWAKVEKTDTCWLWTGYTVPNGYGRISRKGVPIGAHVFSYLLHVGPVPEGLHIDHLCMVKNCVRPDHLEAVTPEENTRRAAAAYRRSEPHLCHVCDAEVTTPRFGMCEIHYRRWVRAGRPERAPWINQERRRLADMKEAS